MEESVKLEQLRYLSEIHRNLHDQRRRVEMRVLTITLSMYGLISFAVLKGDFKWELPLYTEIGIWIVFPGIGLLSAAYLRNIHTANRVNMTIAESAENEIREKIGSTIMDEAIRKIANRSITPYWAWWWQFIIIVLVAVSSAMLITSAA